MKFAIYSRKARRPIKGEDNNIKSPNIAFLLLHVRFRKRLQECRRYNRHR